MKVTAQWIQQHKTKNGGWTRAQIAVLGEDWPPKPGWIDRAVGRELTSEQRATFVRDSAHAKS